MNNDIVGICRQGSTCQCNLLHPNTKGFEYKLLMKKVQLMQKCTSPHNCPNRDYCMYLHNGEVLNVDCENPACLRQNCHLTHPEQLKFTQDEIDEAQLSPDQRVDKSKLIKNRGNDLFKQGRFEEAIEQYNQAVTLYHRESVLYSNRAICYKKLKNWAQVHLDCEQALECDPQNLRAQYLYVLWVIEQQRESKASECIQILQRQYYTLGDIETKAKDIGNTSMSNLIGDKNKLIEFIQLKQQNLIEYQKQQQFQMLIRLIQQSKHPNAESLLEYCERQYLLKQESIVNNKMEIELAECFHCIITFEPFKQPMLTEYGHTYEQSALDYHMKVNGNIDPQSRQPFYKKYILNKQLLEGVQQQQNIQKKDVVRQLSDVQFD